MFLLFDIVAFAFHFCVVVLVCVVVLLLCVLLLFVCVVVVLSWALGCYFCCVLLFLVV